MKQLAELNLFGTQITDAGLKDVAKLEKLSVLWLNNTRITDAGLKEVIKMKQLKGLGLCGCKQITAEDVAELKKALRKCDIDFQLLPHPSRHVQVHGHEANPVLHGWSGGSVRCVPRCRL